VIDGLVASGAPALQKSALSAYKLGTPRMGGVTLHLVVCILRFFPCSGKIGGCPGTEGRWGWVFFFWVREGTVLEWRVAGGLNGESAEHGEGRGLFPVGLEVLVEIWGLGVC